MTNINIGNKIRELRKRKGITQESLASALSVSPQAVSKWESGLTYPDITLIPVIAGYFEVSLDLLFDYDAIETTRKIEALIRNSRSLFYDDTSKYITIIKDALAEYPANEALLIALIEAYEYDLREHHNSAHFDDIIELSQKLISESADFVRICNARELQASTYLQKGDYEKAKTVLDQLPTHVTLKHDTVALLLKGEDKLNGAIAAQKDHLQWLYIACFEEGNAWLDTNANFKEEDVQKALQSYQKGLAVLELFMNHGNEGQDQYLWNGMQTFHWGFYQRIAACLKRLGQIKECELAIDRAYCIVSTAWKNFEEKKNYYMEPFFESLKEYDLGEYVR